MLRRIILTATTSAAALIAAVPVAGATTLPFPLPLLSSPLISPEADRLTVVVSETGYTRADGRYELECSPLGGAGGTHPAAERACSRLDQIAREGSNPFAPVPQGQMCTQQSGGPATARVTGTWHGRPVDAVFSRTDGCEISRWRAMEPVLPSTR